MNSNAICQYYNLKVDINGKLDTRKGHGSSCFAKEMSMLRPVVMAGLCYNHFLCLQTFKLTHTDFVHVRPSQV